MANRTVYVDGTTSGTPGTNGAHYTDLQAAITGEVGAAPDLVTDTCILSIEISITTAEDSAVTLSGFTTNASYYPYIYTTAAARHSGEYSTSKYRITTLPTAGKGALYLDQAYARVTGVQVRITLPSDANNYYGIGGNQPGARIYKDCLVIMDSEAGADCQGYAFAEVPGATSASQFINCAALCTTKRAALYGVGITVAAGGTCDVLNCTIKTFTTGIRQFDGTVTAKNCGFVNCTALHDGTVDHTTTCSEITPTFASGQEFHLDATDTTWRDQGTDLTASGFTTDIDGDTRSGTWDIGCDEYTTTSQYARPNGVAAFGDWDGFISGVDQNDPSNLDNYIDETTADDDDYITSTVDPTNDTCTLELSSISTPDAGTITIRIRAKYL